MASSATGRSAIWRSDANLIARLDEAPATASTADEADEGAEDIADAVPLALAIDLDETASEAPAA
jgi:hypothetical protein